MAKRLTDVQRLESAVRNVGTIKARIALKNALTFLEEGDFDGCGAKAQEAAKTCEEMVEALAPVGEVSNA